MDSYRFSLNRNGFRIFRFSSSRFREMVWIFTRKINPSKESRTCLESEVYPNNPPIMIGRIGRKTSLQNKDFLSRGTLGLEMIKNSIEI